MARWQERLFPLLEALNIGFVAFSPLAKGFLTSDSHAIFNGKLDYRSQMPQYSESGQAKAKPLLELLQQLASEKHVSLAQFSLAWILAQKPYIVPIPGSSKIERIRENAEAVNITFTSTEMQKINNLLAKIDFSVFGE